MIFKSFPIILLTVIVLLSGCTLPDATLIDASARNEELVAQIADLEAQLAEAEAARSELRQEIDNTYYVAAYGGCYLISVGVVTSIYDTITQEYASELSEQCAELTEANLFLELTQEAIDANDNSEYKAMERIHEALQSHLVKEDLIGE